jgi:hypothetical protein
MPESVLAMSQSVRAMPKAVRAMKSVRARSFCLLRNAARA